VQSGVTVPVPGLTPGTLYHFQLVLVAPDGTKTLGGDQSFTTLQPSTITMWANPSTVVTNQPATLTATVTGSGGTPSGTVSFVTGSAKPTPPGFPPGGTPISGCSAQPLGLDSSGSYTATCTAIFAAGNASGDA
jgi:hypothetical protein